MNCALRSVALVLASSAMLLRALLPLGWMPSADAHTPLIICPMMGGTMPAGSDQRGLPHQHDRFCPFTASLAHLSAPAVPLFKFEFFEKPVARKDSAIAFILIDRPYRPQSSRGPPLSA